MNSAFYVWEILMEMYKTYYGSLYLLSLQILLFLWFLIASHKWEGNWCYWVYATCKAVCWAAHALLPVSGPYLCAAGLGGLPNGPHWYHMLTPSWSCKLSVGLHLCPHSNAWRPAELRFGLSKSFALSMLWMSISLYFVRVQISNKSWP